MNAIKTQRQVEKNKMSELVDFKQDISDYLNKDIFELDEDDKLYKVIKCINALPMWQQNLIYLYAMIGTYSGLAAKLNVSIGIVHKHINTIIKNIKENI